MESVTEAIIWKETKALRREVKRAKVFAMQRQIRQMKQLENKKGSDAQIEKNRRRVGRLEQELEFLKDADIEETVRIITEQDGVQRVVNEENAHGDMNLKNRALSKIINSKTLQSFMQKRETRNQDQSKGNPGVKKRKREGRKKIETKMTHDNIGVDEQKLKHKADDEGLKKIKEKRKPIGKKLRMMTRENGAAESDLKNVESCFVRSMSRLKEGRTAKFRNKWGRNKGKIYQNRESKNRKGQRQRQKMWEEIYGSNAKHLRKKTGQTKSQGHTESMKWESKIKTENGPKGTLKPLHPSWEAMKKKRLQETVNLEFKGQKIRFDDSE